MIGMYLVTFAVLIITGARLGYMYGYRKLLLLGVAVFGFSSLPCALSPTIEVLIAGRALQGVGAALMFPQTLTGIHLYFSGPERLHAMGLYSMALAAGAVVGQMLGGLLIAANIAQLGWRSLFLLYLPICAAIMLAGLKFLPKDKPQTAQRIDILGVSVLSLGILLLIVPLTIGREMGWPWWSWSALLASGPVLYLFIRTQTMIAKRVVLKPLIVVSVVFRPTIVWGLLSMLFATATYYAFIYTFSIYYQQALALNALVVALLLSPWALGFAVSGYVLRRIPLRFNRFVPSLSYVIFALTYLGISAVVAGRTEAAVLLAAIFILSGIAQGGGFIGLMGQMTNSISKNYASDLSGVSTTAIEISGALGVSIFGGLYSILAISNNDIAQHRAFVIICLALGGVAFVSAIAAWLSSKKSEAL